MRRCLIVIAAVAMMVCFTACGNDDPVSGSGQLANTYENQVIRAGNEYVMLGMIELDESDPLYESIGATRWYHRYFVVDKRDFRNRSSDIGKSVKFRFKNVPEPITAGELNDKLQSDFDCPDLCSLAEPVMTADHVVQVYYASIVVM